MIHYWNPTAEMFATIARDGSVFLHPEDGKWKDRTRNLTVADLKKELTNATTVL